MGKDIKERKKALFARPRQGYDRLGEGGEAAMEAYCREYKDFIGRCKTERECVAFIEAAARARGFVPFARGAGLKSGDKVYRVNRGKSIALAVIGQQPLSGGLNIAAAHIDSPRIDLKPNPLYEDASLAYFKTHYYGGIRKYQWVTIPLELHGVVIRRDGSMLTVCLGAGDEPKLVITDLLPHLSQEQNKKALAQAFTGEDLNILIGSRPTGEEGDSDRVKLAILERLFDKYAITEEDFLSAELEAVPAAAPTDIGLDASLIGAYGHDDRVCAYAALQALFAIDAPQKTAVCMLADKEEIGSMGVTGMQSAAFDAFMKDLCEAQGVPLRACYENSFCLSADVTAAFDPNYPEVFERRNDAVLNGGMALCKYTGGRGKSGASDASAETVAFVRRVLDDAGVVWQLCDMGKVDVGGGGTVAQFMANRNIATIDAGVPVLSMHAPFETVSKLDCYMTHLGCRALYEAE